MTSASAGTIRVFAIVTAVLAGLAFLVPDHGSGAKTGAAKKELPPKKPAVKADAQRDAVKPLDYRKRSEARAKIEEALQQKAQLDIVDLTLKDTVAQIRDLFKVQILIDDDGLGDQGIHTDTLVNVRLKGITLKSALRIILERLGLDFIIKNEVLVITTQEKADEHFEVQLHDTRHIKNLNSSQLIEVLENTTTGPWFEIEGVGGTMSAVPGGLIVRQTQRMHEEITELLEQLAKMPAMSEAELRKYAVAETDRRIKVLERRVTELERQIRQMKPKAKAGGGFGGGGFF